MNLDPHGGNVYVYEGVRLDFSVNLNPLGMPEEVLQAVRDHGPVPQRLLPPEHQKGAVRRVHRKAQRPESVRHPGALLAKVLPGPLLPMGQTQRRQPRRLGWGGDAPALAPGGNAPSQVPIGTQQIPQPKPRHGIQLGKGPEHNQVGIPGQQSLAGGRIRKGQEALIHH